MDLSILSLFSIGIGPSSSHCVGPMRAARLFALHLRDTGQLSDTARIEVELFGSLALTGKGHGTDKAILLGLSGEVPETVDPQGIDAFTAKVRQQREIICEGQAIGFDPEQSLRFEQRELLPLHTNGMRFTALDQRGISMCQECYYSVGGGFVVDDQGKPLEHDSPSRPLPFPFRSAAELLEHAETAQYGISEITQQNELAFRSEDELNSRLNQIWQTMQECVRNGSDRNDSDLPGPLRVRRRAPQLYRNLVAQQGVDPLAYSDWVDVFALAVSEENAAGGRVVTAPTNGAAGILPAVLHYYERFCEGASIAGVRRMLLTAGAIGLLYKQNASISGAEVGCQGEVGVACSMAAGALAEVLGGSPRHVEQAAEIAMEHHLGLTCDPVGGLVQIPCIERNAMAASQAIHAARLALHGDGSHRVSLDRVIETMKQTGRDMLAKYKETSQGGLAVNVIAC